MMDISRTILLTAMVSQMFLTGTRWTRHTRATRLAWDVRGAFLLAPCWSRACVPIRLPALLLFAGTEQSWNADSHRVVAWDKLTHEERAKAYLLGYNAKTWPAEPDADAEKGDEAGAEEEEVEEEEAGEAGEEEEEEVEEEAAVGDDAAEEREAVEKEAVEGEDDEESMIEEAAVGNDNLRVWADKSEPEKIYAKYKIRVAPADAKLPKNRQWCTDVKEIRKLQRLVDTTPLSFFEDWFVVLILNPALANPALVMRRVAVSVRK